MPVDACDASTTHNVYTLVNGDVAWLEQGQAVRVESFEDIENMTGKQLTVLSVKNWEPLKSCQN